MRISARNCLEGKIVAIKEGPVTTEVTIETAAGEKIVSSITTNSAQNLGLKVGDKGGCHEFCVLRDNSRPRRALPTRQHAKQDPTQTYS